MYILALVCAVSHTKLGIINYLNQSVGTAALYYSQIRIEYCHLKDYRIEGGPGDIPSLTAIPWGNHMQPLPIIISPPPLQKSLIKPCTSAEQANVSTICL